MNLSRRRFFRIFVAALLAVQAFSSLLNAQAPSGRHPVRVLFIGNSYTYFNNLPEIFRKLAEAGHQPKIETSMVAPGGWRLKDHWEKGETAKVLHTGEWDYVVLQEQSRLGVNYYVEGKAHVAGDQFFTPYAEKWAAEVRNAGATPIFFLTWAYKTAPEDQAALNYAYMRAGKESRALVAPVGIAWARVREQHPAIELFLNDGSHPSPAGSYLVACTLYATIFRKDPSRLPAKIRGAPVNLATARAETGRTAVLVDLPARQARALQSSAWAAWQELERNGGYLDASPAPVPSVLPLPAGGLLSNPQLEGIWRGNIAFYPTGPAEMVLQLHLEAGAWRGHLELKYHSKDVPDASFDLAELRIGDREIRFTDPESAAVGRLKVQFRGVRTQTGELRGIAETNVEKPDWPIRLLGTWELRWQ